MCFNKSVEYCFWNWEKILGVALGAYSSWMLLKQVWNTYLIILEIYWIRINENSVLPKVKKTDKEEEFPGRELNGQPLDVLEKFYCLSDIFEARGS